LLGVVVGVEVEVDVGVVVGVDDEVGVVVGVVPLEPEVPPEPGVVELGVVPEPGVVMTLDVFGVPEPTTAGVTCGAGAGVTAVTVLAFDVPTG
jgi:hypothetical protein